MPSTELPPLDPRDLELTRVLNHPREKVFRTWTTPELLTEWWGPEGITTPEVTMELRPGGTFRTLMQLPDGTQHDNTGVFIDVVAPELVVFSDALSKGCRPNAKPFMTAFIYFLEEPGGKTRYVARVLHATEEEKQKHEEMGFFPGWGGSLDRFEALLARLP